MNVRARTFTTATGMQFVIIPTGHLTVLVEVDSVEMELLAKVCIENYKKCFCHIIEMSLVK